MPTVFNHRLLARVRLDLNLTQEEAAAAVGVDVRTYRRYESGEVNDAGEGFSVRHPSRRRILLHMERELGIPEGELLVEGTEGPGNAEVAAPAAVGWIACHGHTLPRAQHFVGRQDLLDRLRSWWQARDPDAHVIALVALGGAGKTSLGERFLASIGDGPHPGGVFVYSFYDDDRVEAFFERALAYFAPGRALVGAGDRLDAVQAALRDGGAPHLVVLDGIEVLQGSGEAETTYGRVEEGALRRLLTAAARGIAQARFLITSRFDLTDLAAWEGSGLCTVKLDALSDAESVELLGRWGLAGGPNELCPLLERVGRHALSVAMIGSYAGSFLGGDPARLRGVELDRLLSSARLEPAARDDLQARRLLAVLSTYARALSPEERDVIARLAVFPAGAEMSLLLTLADRGGAAAGTLTGLDEAQIVPILARLERLGLIFGSKERRFAAHPFVAQYFQSILGVEVEAIHALERQRLTTRLDRHQGAPAEQELLDTHELLLFHTLHSGRAEEAAKIYFSGLGGFAHLGLRLGAMSRGARILRSFAHDGDPARMSAALTAGRRARILYDWGLYAGALGDLPLAIRCYRAHNVLARDGATLEALSTGLRTLAYTERLTGALDEALALVDAALDVAESAASGGDMVKATSLRASILHDLGRHADADEEFARAAALGAPPFARRSLWEAEHALEVGRVDHAIDLAKLTLENMHELGWGGHVAHAHTILALALLRLAEPQVTQARVHLEAACRWTSATGEVEVVLRCLEAEARIELAAGRLDRAADARRRGRELAETCGFGLFARRF